MAEQSKHLHAEPEYTPRANYGVVACVCTLNDGRVRLILDDVCSDSGNWPQKDFDADVFQDCHLTEEQLAHIG